MRVRTLSHVVFAATMVGLGILGLVTGKMTPVWAPVPRGVPAQEMLGYLCAIISLACGVGLLVQRTAAIAARVLLGYLLLWVVLFRVPNFFFAPTAQDTWSGIAETSVIVAGAWVVYAWLAGDWDKRRFAFATGDSGVRVARLWYGLAMIPFGEAHFRYIKATAGLIPSWIPWHLFWAYFFGCTFLAAGVGVLLGVLARLAAALSTVQLALFTTLVWFPMVAGRSANGFQWSETIVSWAITIGAWVVADSYRGVPWLAVNER